MLDEDEPRVRLREVMLWGRAVWLDDISGRVYCAWCQRLVDVAELSAADNTHPIGLRAREGVPIAMRDDDRRPAPDNDPARMAW